MNTNNNEILLWVTLIGYWSTAVGTIVWGFAWHFNKRRSKTFFYLTLLLTIVDSVGLIMGLSLGWIHITPFFAALNMLAGVWYQILAFRNRKTFANWWLSPSDLDQREKPSN